MPRNETTCPPVSADRVEQIIFDYVYDAFGRSEAVCPSWCIPDLARHIASSLNAGDYIPEHEIEYID